jgi:hypothetical protein
LRLAGVATAVLTGLLLFCVARAWPSREIDAGFAAAVAVLYFTLDFDPHSH